MEKTNKYIEWYDNKTNVKGDVLVKKIGFKIVATEVYNYNLYFQIPFVVGGLINIKDSTVYFKSKLIHQFGVTRTKRPCNTIVYP